MQTQGKNLDELVKQYYTGNSNTGSESSAPASRDDIVNFVNNKGVTPNDQSQPTTEQGAIATATDEPLEQAQDPASAEARIDKVLNEQAPGTVEPTPAGDGTGAGSAGDSGEPATSSAGGEGDHGAAGVPANDAEVEQQPAPNEQTGTDTQGGEEGSPQSGSEDASQSAGNSEGSDSSAGSGATGVEGTEGSAPQALDGQNEPDSGSESDKAENQEPGPEESGSEESSATQGGEEDGDEENQLEDSGNEVSPEDASVEDPTDSVDSASTVDDSTDSEETAATEQTPEEQAQAVKAGKDAAQELAVAADAPAAAPDPESAVEEQSEREAPVVEQNQDAQSETQPETEDGQAPVSAEAEAMAPEIGVFDTAEKVLAVNPSHEVLARAEDTQSDTQVIKKAYELNSRLGDYARIITDRFPSDKPATTEQSQESLAFIKISKIGLEALIENGKELLGEEFDPGEDNPVQEAIIKSKDNVLTNLNAALKDLGLVFKVTEDITSRAQAVIEAHDERSGTAISETAYRIFTSLSVHNKIEFGGFGASAALNNVLGDIKNWLASDYYNLLASLEKTNEGRIQALCLASLPELSRAEELKSENDSGFIVTRRSECLPGETYIEQRKASDGELSANFGFDGVDPFDAENPQKVVVPSKIEVQTLLNELNNAVICAQSYQDLLERLEASVQAFYAWYADADPEQVVIEGAHHFVQGLDFIAQFGAYLTNYVQALAAYVLLEA